MVAYQVIKDFLTKEEIRSFDHLVKDKTSLFSETSGRGNLGPRYYVIDGDQVSNNLPEISSFEQRIRFMVEQFAGHPVQLLAGSRRSMRIQIYSKRSHGFRWHFDGHSYVAILTLKNTNLGQTQVISSQLSRYLRFLFYPLYPFPHIFSIAPHETIVSEPGSLLLMRGAKLLHRGVTLKLEGERILIVYTYDEAGKKSNRLRDFIARRLNY